MNESAFEQLIGIIRSKSSLIEDESSTNRTDDRPELFFLFTKAIKKTLAEIKDGASSDDFAELSVVNLIILGARYYSAEEMRSFIHRLRTDDPEDGDLDDILRNM